MRAALLHPVSDSQGAEQVMGAVWGKRGNGGVQGNKILVLQ